MNVSFFKLAAERAAKTFAQFYFGMWLFAAGIVDIDAVGGESAGIYDQLFTMDNVKAGIVGVALSIATSLGSKPFGVNKESPSLVD